MRGAMERDWNAAAGSWPTHFSGSQLPAAAFQEAAGRIADGTTARFESTLPCPSGRMPTIPSVLLPQWLAWVAESELLRMVADTRLQEQDGQQRCLPPPPDGLGPRRLTTMYEQ